MSERAGLVEGEDFYREGAYVVFTARYLLRRGYCCGSGCRHCPYESVESAPGAEVSKERVADAKRKATKTRAG